MGRARRELQAAARSWDLADEVVESGRLVVSELVTNGVLHANTGLRVVFTRAGAGVRIEVHDASTRPVLAPVAANFGAGGLLDDPTEEGVLARLVGNTGTTGRGLALVQASSESWGVTALSGGGKAVWAEVGTGPVVAGGAVADPSRQAPAGAETPAEGLWGEATVSGTTPLTGAQPLGARRGPDPSQGAPETGNTPAAPAAPGGGLSTRHPVRIIAVPVRLLVESDRHFEDLARELQVIGLDPTASADLRELAEQAAHVHRLAAGAQETNRRTSRAALQRGDRLVDISLVMATDTVTGLAALGRLLRKATAAAGEGRILTLPPGREVSDYRGWFLEEVVAQMNGRPPRPCPFPVVPASTGASVEEGQVDHQRVLAELRSDLDAAPGADSACAITLERALAWGAHRAALCMLEGDNETVRLGPARAFSKEVASHWATFPLSADLPASETIRTGHTVVTRTLAEREYRYPVFLATPAEDDQTIVCVPLPHGDRALGCLVLGLSRSGDLHGTQLALAQGLGIELGTVLGRLRTAEAGEAAVARDRFLATAEQAAATATDGREMVVGLVRDAVGVVAEWCGAHLAGDDGSPQLLAAAHAEAEKEALATVLHSRWPPGPHSPISTCLRTGQETVFQVTHDAALVESAQGSEHLEVLRGLQLGSGAVVPITDGRRVWGAFSLANGPGRFISEAELAAARELGCIAGAALTRLASSGPTASR